MRLWGQRDQTYRLNSFTEFDDSHFGGSTVDKKWDCGTEKTKVFVALSLDKRGNPRYLKIRATSNIKKEAVKKFTQSSFAKGYTVRSDGYHSYIPALERFSYEHKPHDSNSRLFHCLHVIINNAKAFILDPYYGLPKKTFDPIWTSIPSVSVAATSDRRW